MGDWSPIFTKHLAWPAALLTFSHYPTHTPQDGLLQARGLLSSQFNSWCYLTISNISHGFSPCVTSFTWNWADQLAWEVTEQQRAFGHYHFEVLSEAEAHYLSSHSAPLPLPFGPVKGTIQFDIIWISGIRSQYKKSTLLCKLPHLETNRRT